MQLGLSNSDPVVLLAQRYPAQECEEACESPESKKVSFSGQQRYELLLKFMTCILTHQQGVQGEIERETERLEVDFSGCLWFSYRAGFSPLGKCSSVYHASLVTASARWCSHETCAAFVL